MITALVGSSADPVDVGHIIAFSIDAATRRLLELGIAEQGEPSFRWAWLALGSAARQEQAIRTDQDHAMAFEGDPDPGRVAGATGRIRDRGSRGGRDLPLQRRRDGDERRAAPLAARLGSAVRVWMNVQCPKASEQLSIIFDFRRVAGTLEADAARRVMATAVNRPIFLTHLARRALDLRPPIGFVRGLTVENRGEHPGNVDMKHGGILIVRTLARAPRSAPGSPRSGRPTAAGVRACGGDPRGDPRGARGGVPVPLGGPAPSPRRADAAPGSHRTISSTRRSSAASPVRA